MSTLASNKCPSPSLLKVIILINALAINRAFTVNISNISKIGFLVTPGALKIGSKGIIIKQNVTDYKLKCFMI